MKRRFYLVITWLLCTALASCTSVPVKITQPTQAAIPTDLAFSTPLVQLLRQSGLNILAVRNSTYTAMFQSTDKAAWIKTDKGIVEAIFFADSAEVEQIHIAEQVNKTDMRYLYTIQAPPAILLHDQTIDAAFPLYFTTKDNMLMITSSAELDETLKKISPER